MATEFSIGVVIGGAVSGAFRSAMGGTQRALSELSSTSRQLQSRQQALTQAMTRYGQISTRTTTRLNNELQQVSRTMERLQNQHTRLSAATARSKALQNQRMALYAQGAETYALARTAASPFVQSAKQYAQFESGLRDIAVTGDLDSEQEQAIGAAIRQAAGKFNQTQETLLSGVGQLVADGMDPKQAAGMVELLGKTATATKADMTDLAKMTFAFSDALKITDENELKEAFALAAAGAKMGSFELKDMAKALPTLSKTFAARGMTGKEAIKQIVASLEVAKGSGSAEDAVTNMTNWMAVMTRGDTVKKYEGAGIDYEKSMQSYLSQGISQYEASLMIADKFIKGKGDAFMKQWEEAKGKGDEEAMRKLMESFGLSEIFTDIQTVNHLMSMRQGWDKYQEQKKKMDSPESQQVLDTDFDKQNDTLEARQRRATVALNEMAISIGSSLRPALVQLAESVIPLIDTFSQWLAANPELVANTAKLVAGFIAFKAASVGGRLALNLLFSPLADCVKAVELLRGKWMLMQTVFSAGGKLRGAVQLFGSVAKGAGTLGRILGGSLLKGVTLVGRAVLFLGRALIMNPIGLIIMAIAGAAYLIYKYWGPISSFFKRLWGWVTQTFRDAWNRIKAVWGGVTGWFSSIWSEVKTAFSGGIVGVGKLITNWSPVGLFYKAFAGVMKYFGIDLPKNFTDFGSNIIDGLVNGISNKLTAAKDTIVGFGSSVSGWFKETLGIQSPSRVFMGFGDNIAQGAAIGIDRTASEAIGASARMAAAMVPDLPTENLGMMATLAGKPLVQPKARLALPEVPELPEATPLTRAGRSAKGAGPAGGIQITFSPQITVQGQAQSPASEIGNALSLSIHELEKMLDRVMAQRERRGYA